MTVNSQPINLINITQITQHLKINLMFKLDLFKITSNIIWTKWLTFTSSKLVIKNRKGEMTINKIIAILLGLVVVALTASLFISLKTKATGSINCICTPAYSGIVPPGCKNTIACP
ncbi:MAG: hypothetical protein K0B02_04890 [DPANN group archaeon]|nr:hypothetical protein [DPANN group archaeon]